MLRSVIYVALVLCGSFIVFSVNLSVNSSGFWRKELPKELIALAIFIWFIAFILFIITEIKFKI